jgi:hypothetical protein
MLNIMAYSTLRYHDVHKDNLLYHYKLKYSYSKIEIRFFLSVEDLPYTSRLEVSSSICAVTIRLSSGRIK